ncbi:pyridine nucleotide-disulfide oxidoreductase [Stappia sp. GBMRC 2046]|uniref:Pyridine nucleotide-disulfide oxidoreductase n=1 Tax=Stappia sediminis TaxID=2692190 RepID=A0A7X3LU53_9HYPH|nr:FAD-dependent oxidoreductase [Stappia sediminis]MXN65166.1 pyridine nucleotide-disulfide oxidoreductase [Stappia sediminis]
MQDRIVVLGAGQAAAQLVQSLRQNGHEGEIVLIGDEPHPPYQRPPLSKKYLMGEVGNDTLELRPSSFYETQSVELHLGVKAEAVDREKKLVKTSGGEEIAYDRLVFATGTRARGLPLAGADLPGVVSLRTIADVDAIRPALEGEGRIAIVGGGYIGLEVAAVARSLGREVTVLEGLDRVMKRVVSPVISDFYQKLHHDNGVDIRLNVAIEAFEGTARVEAVRFADGSRLDCDLVLVAVGAAPNDELAAACGLDVSDGILVDGAGRTSDEAVYAAGDCTRFFSARYGRSIRLESVQNAIDQAKAVAADICGKDVDYDPVPWFWSDQYHVKLQIAGLSQGYDEAITVGDPASGSFYVAYLKDEKLIAVDSINHARSHMMARRAMGESWRDDLLPPA